VTSAFWRGFCGDDSDEIGTMMTGRCWPQDDDDPADW